LTTQADGIVSVGRFVLGVKVLYAP
jgi:hypothetical protein